MKILIDIPEETYKKLSDYVDKENLMREIYHYKLFSEEEKKSYIKSLIVCHIEKSLIYNLTTGRL